MAEAEDAKKEKEEELFPSEVKAYTVSGKIGEGSSGVIYSAYCMSKGVDVAIKVIDINAVANKQNVLKECTLTTSLQHKNLVSSLSAFCYGGQCWIIMPLFKASCLDILKTSFQKGLQNEQWVASILNDVLQGLEYIHELNFVHRDIKASAILIGSDGVAKISDFGVAGMVVNSNHGKTFVGISPWMAPEVMDANRQAVAFSDIWSLGITALELISGTAPRSKLQLKDLISENLNSEPPDIQASAGRPVTSSFKEFCYSCLQKDPKDRKSASELRQLGFFKDLVPKEKLVEALKLDLEENIYITVDEDEAPVIDKDANLDFKVVMGGEKEQVQRQGGGALKNIVLELNEQKKEYTIGEDIEVYDSESDRWVDAKVCIVGEDDLAVAFSEKDGIEKVPRMNTRRKR